VGRLKFTSFSASMQCYTMKYVILLLTADTERLISTVTIPPHDFVIVNS